MWHEHALIWTHIHFRQLGKGYPDSSDKDHSRLQCRNFLPRTELLYKPSSLNVVVRLPIAWSSASTIAARASVYLRNVYICPHKNSTIAVFFLFTQIHEYRRTDTCRHMQTHIQIHTKYIHTHINTHTYIHTYIHTFIYAHIHTCTHKHTQEKACIIRTFIT